MTFDDPLTRVAQVTAKVVPISVDIESGTGEGPERLIAGLLSVEAVGLNGGQHRPFGGRTVRSRRARGADRRCGVPPTRRRADGGQCRTDLFLHCRR